MFERAGFATAFERSFEKFDAPDTRATEEQIAGCAILLEQVDIARFPRANALPDGCPIVRFPSLDTILLWPFNAVNPYDDPIGEACPSGRFSYGNRVLLRHVEMDWDADRIIDYYERDYDDYKVDLTRVAQLERRRLQARDEKADVAMADVSADVVTAPLFWGPNHPRAALLEVLARRLLSAAAALVPELASLRIDEGTFERYESERLWSALPIDPGVAADLGLTWYDPKETYLLEDGKRWSRAEYLRGFVNTAIANRREQAKHGMGDRFDPYKWLPPLDGPARFVGPAFGMYPDMFAAPLLRFEIEASAPVESFAVDAYYPPQHPRAATMSLSSESSHCESSVGPGQPFSLSLALPLVQGERARLVLRCSERLNMLERGESEDDRDLGVVILGMHAK